MGRFLAPGRPGAAADLVCTHVDRSGQAPRVGVSLRLTGLYFALGENFDLGPGLRFGFFPTGILGVVLALRGIEFDGTRATKDDAA